MLHRSTSSRRRRASRSAASSPQTRACRSAATSPGRRASIAVSPVDSERAIRNVLTAEINRSPRHSIIPDISLNTATTTSTSLSSRDDFDVDNVSIARSPRPSLTPEMLSPRNSLVPDPSAMRSPRHSLAPGDPYHRSPRNSLVPDNGYSNRSPRNSLVPEVSKSPRNSLVPDASNRSPRHSLVPDNNVHGSRISLAPDFNRSPRNSLVPEMIGRGPRHSITPSESMQWNGNDDEVMPCKSPRHSIVPETNRSPRGSIAPETLSIRTSPRGSIAGDYYDRSPRGSIGPELNRKSPRGSLTLTFQEPPEMDRRHSTDNSSGEHRNRSVSPYRSGSKGAINLGYSAISETGSRRASSSVSQGLLQVSGDEQRRLCAEQKYVDGEQGLGLSLSLTTYGSVAYQLKDANLEASSTCDFICKALNIVNKTVVVTIVLVCLSALPMIMLIMGVQFLRDCPREPYIPVYMVVGGTLGCVKMAWLLWNQLYTRRVDVHTMNASASSIGSKVASFALTLFLIVWFVMGNYWILRIKWPEYAPTLFEPNKWCHRTLYVFSLVHLFVVYSVFGCIILLVIALAGSQIFGCTWLGPGRYK